MKIKSWNQGRSTLEKLADRFKSFSPHTIALLLWTGLAFACLAFFFRIAFTIHMGGAVQSLDERTLRFIGTELRSSGWDFFFVDLSSLGSLAVVTALCVISTVLFFLARDPAAVIHLLLIAIGGFQIGAWSKGIIERSRPTIIPRLIQVGGRSFPSGHAVTASAIYLTLAILACRHFKGHAARVTLFALAGLMISAVAFSRVYLGVHYPSDVLSGALLGSAWALLLGAFFSKQHFFKKARHS